MCKVLKYGFQKAHVFGSFLSSPRLKSQPVQNAITTFSSTSCVAHLDIVSLSRFLVSEAAGYNYRESLKSCYDF